MGIYKRTMKVKLAIAIFGLSVAGVLLGCSKKPSPKETARSRFSEEQLSARFPWDLGENQIDVASYPAEQQEAHGLMASKCAACHKLARVFNSPFVERQDWERFVKRMHLKTGKQIDKKAMKRIIDFLVYDSRIRKVEQRDYFQNILQNLEILYQQVQEEKQRIGFVAAPSPDAKMIDYTGDKP